MVKAYDFDDTKGFGFKADVVVGLVTEVVH